MRSRTLAVLVVLVSVALLLSRDVDRKRAPWLQPEGAAAASSPSSAPSEPSPTTTINPAEQIGSGNPVTIAFAGDINFEREMATRLRNDPSTAIGPFAEVLSAADLAVGNLEAALTSGGAPVPKQYNFRAPPAAVDALRAAGFDAVSVANNHGMDYGPDGFADTLAVKDAQPDHFIIGAGHNDADAYSPYTATVKGQRISVIAATQVIDDALVAEWASGLSKPGLASAKREDRLIQAVRDARAISETVVVYLHWGTDRNDCPNARQQALARALSDAGADIVVGGHAHVLQGAGRLGPTFVAYGLGNFAFWSEGNGTRTGVLQVTITGRRVDGYEFVPGRVSNRVPRPLEGQEATDAVAYWNSLRSCTGLTP